VAGVGEGPILSIVENDKRADAKEGSETGFQSGNGARDLGIGCAVPATSFSLMTARRCRAADVLIRTSKIMTALQKRPKPPPPTANGMLSACYRAWVGFGRGIGGLGIRDLEPPPLLKPSAEQGAHIFRATSLCAPPNLSQTIGINVILFELHCAAPYEL
jgi:hypothetical protein